MVALLAVAVAVAAAKAAVVTDVLRHGGVVVVDDDEVGVALRKRHVKLLFILALHTEDRPGGCDARPTPEKS